MGTHMWSSSQQASRRGRRMSLELPPPLHGGLPIGLTAKDSEFLQRRPELLFPYLPAAHFSGANASPSSLVNAVNGLPKLEVRKSKKFPR